MHVCVHVMIHLNTLLTEREYKYELNEYIYVPVGMHTHVHVYINEYECTGIGVDTAFTSVHSLPCDSPIFLLSTLLQTQARDDHPGDAS
jgi:hypothetical protein